MYETVLVTQTDVWNDKKGYVDHDLAKTLWNHVWVDEWTNVYILILWSLVHVPICKMGTFCETREQNLPRWLSWRRPGKWVLVVTAGIKCEWDYIASASLFERIKFRNHLMYLCTVNVTCTLLLYVRNNSVIFLWVILWLVSCCCGIFLNVCIVAVCLTLLI